MLDAWNSVARAAVIGGLVWLAAMPIGAFAAELRNLAPDAVITESGRHSERYAGRFTANGRIPEPGSRSDLGRAWCVPQSQAAGAWLSYSWPEPVTIGEIIYYGRTAWLWDENFLKVEILVDPDQPIVAQADLRPGHGPQRITLARPIRTKTLTLRFPIADSGPNPGASEIRIFAASPDPATLGVFITPDGHLDITQSQPLVDKIRSGELGFDSLLVIERQSLRPSHVYTYHNEDFRPGGGLYRWYSHGERERLFDAQDGQLLDLSLSYDGREILFSWRRTESETYQIYRMNVDGTGLVQLTDGAHYNFNPCWLPDGGIAFLSTRTSAYAYCWNSPVGVLYRMDRDGSNPVRLSANYLNDFTPTVLDDGRIIFARWEYVDRPAIPIQSLWTIRPDGTGLQVYFGNRVLSPATFMEARSLPGSDKILCLLTAHNGPARGAVGIIDRRLGVNAQEAIRNLTPEVNIGRVDQGDGNHIRGPYENPFPLDENYFIVSHSGSILVRDYEGVQQAVLLAARGLMGFYNPQPVRATAAPPVLPSANSVAGPLPLPPNTAAVYLQDVYQGLEPHVDRGEIVAVRVVEEIAKPVEIHPNLRAFGFQFPVVSSGATYAPKRVWGQVPIEPDGSAAFEVPAGRPLYFMALDRHGRAVQRMRSFTHFMAGESQSCVGCHEDRSHAPPAADLPSAFDKLPRPLEPPEWGVQGFSYRRIIQPVLDRHCVQCHQAHSPSGGVDLSGDTTDFFNVSYETLARQGTPAENSRIGGARQVDFRNPYTSWISTYNGSESNILQIEPRTWGSPASRLADLVLDGHPDARGKLRIDLSDAEKRRIFAWIDLNVPYYGTSDTNHPERPGCRQMWPDDFDRVFQQVTARRCAECHLPDQQGIASVPRSWYLRIEQPEKNRFMLAPLAVRAGGTESCDRAVFETKDDPDYQALLALFQPIQELLADRPRRDLYGEPAETCVTECSEPVDGQ